MNINRTGGVSGVPAQLADGFEIHPVGVPELVANVSVSELDPHDAAASFHVLRQAASAIAPLTRMLGVALTAGNPAWSGDPVPKMRALQKKLLEQGMQQSESVRHVSLAAISVVEKNIQLRLRLHQLHIGNLQSQAEPEHRT